MIVPVCSPCTVDEDGSKMRVPFRTYQLKHWIPSSFLFRPTLHIVNGFLQVYRAGRAVWSSKRVQAKTALSETVGGNNLISDHRIDFTDHSKSVRVGLPTEVFTLATMYQSHHTSYLPDTDCGTGHVTNHVTKDHLTSVDNSYDLESVSLFLSMISFSLYRSNYQ